MLDDLEDKPKDWNQYTCPDNFEGTKRNPTEVIFVGYDHLADYFTAIGNRTMELIYASKGNGDNKS